MQSYFEICSVVSKELLRKLAEGLGADEATSDGVVVAYDQHTSYLRLNHYPVCGSAAPENTPTIFNKEEWGDLAVGRHTDAGGVTILLMDGVRGLQMERNDVWTTIEFKRHDLIVNIGDMIQVLSNDNYIAPQHRVIASATQERFSAPFFLNPSWESVITPLPCCSDDKENKQGKYRPLPWKEFRSLRALGDYKDAGEEVQIAHYKYSTSAT
jgi:isopenicillin N synthase-like dioxygenase